MGRGGGGQVVSVLTLYSDNPAESYSFFSKNLCLKQNQNKQKDARVGPFKTDRSTLKLKKMK